MPNSSDLWALNKIYFILLFEMPMKDDTDGNYVFSFNGAEAWPVFLITINEINGHEFSVILALNFIFLSVMAFSEIFNGDDFRFNF